jgi:hypothetical protein
MQLTFPTRLPASTPGQTLASQPAQRQSPWHRAVDPPLTDPPRA